MTKFQIIFLVTFGFIGAIGMLVFSGLIPFFKTGSESGISGEVIVWGTKETAIFEAGLNSSGFPEAEENVKVNYQQKDPATFDRELIEALADDVGPDLLLIENDQLLSYLRKIYILPYDLLPLRSFLDTYVPAGQIFLSDSGVLALPLLIDPIVMYGNLNKLSAAGFISPPVFWEDINPYITRLTKRDKTDRVIEGVFPLGEFDNVPYAKELILMLSFALGDRVIEREPGAGYVVSYGDSQAAEDILTFYTQFADPAKESYTWGRSMPNARNAFLSGLTSFYFGRASERLTLKNRNPHLNYDIFVPPQFKEAPKKISYGFLTSVALLSAAKNQSAAYAVMNAISSKESVAAMAELSGEAPALKELLTSARGDDPTAPNIYASALIAEGFLDPDKNATNLIFKEAVNNILSGRLSGRESARLIGDRLELLMNQRQI